MAHTAQPDPPPTDTVQRLLLRLCALVVLLTLAALIASQMLTTRMLRESSQAWAAQVAAEMLRRQPDLPALLRGGVATQDQLDTLAALPLPPEFGGFWLFGADGRPWNGVLAAPSSLGDIGQIEVPVADEQGEAGRLMLGLRDAGRRQAMTRSFHIARAGIAGFGLVMLLLLLWLGLRGRREEAAAARARHQLRHDSLTGLATHAELRRLLAWTLARARPEQRQVGVLVMNLRGFRDVNALHGRQTGDMVLEALARRLRGMVRPADIVARLSADRFAVVQTAMLADEDAVTLAERLAGAMAEPLPLPDGPSLELSVELGLAVSPQDGSEAELLLARAEAALFAARHAPERAISGFEPSMDESMRNRREIETDLRRAIEAQALTLHYQPQRRLRDQRLTGFEALLRWPHPTRGMVSPIEFIPIAEQNGMIVPLGAWVIRTACAEAARWPGELHVAVNLSPAQFRHGDLVSTVADALARSGLPACRLELEITESLLQEDPEDVVRLLRDLRGLGVSIAMDDFGTGWSSLAHLWRFPFGKLKIDRAFVTELARDPKLSAIIATIVGLGRILDMGVVAEGVETEEQARILAAEGCEQAQGWLFGRPMPADAARRLIGEEQAKMSRSVA